jgi:transposase InsO family protein
LPVVSGVPVRLYIDNAKIYRSRQLARSAASLGILIVHTPPYQPEGRGKIERYFRTVRDQFLTNLDRKQSFSLEALNDRYWTWLEKRLSPLTLRLARGFCLSADK